MNQREQYIIRQLAPVAGRSRDARQRAIDRLIAEGYSEQEISSALRQETERLQKERDALRP